MAGFSSLFQRVEACKGSDSHMCLLVPLVGLQSLRSFYILTDTCRSDIAYYGINLNQSVILAKIGFAKGSTHWETLYKTAVGNIIVQSAVR